MTQEWCGPPLENDTLILTLGVHPPIHLSIVWGIMSIRDQNHLGQSKRQTLITVHITKGTHAVRIMAAMMNMCKPFHTTQYLCNISTKWNWCTKMIHGGVRRSGMESQKHEVSLGVPDSRSGVDFRAG